MDERVILAVLAHPDDETFGMGGTLALYARQGVQVHLACATRGEVGVMDPQYQQGFDTPGARREYELRCAAGHLGLAGVHFLDYRDSGMPGSPDNLHPQALAAASLEDVARKIARLIRELRPQVVITFDPIGGYKHPDHIAIHNATIAAIDLAGIQDDDDERAPHRPTKLYFQVIPKNFLKVGVFLLRLFGRDPRRFGRNRDIDLGSLVQERDFPVHTRIDYRPVMQQLLQAAACHASQGGSEMFSRGPVAFFRRWLGGKDHYMRAFPPPAPRKIETDLFENMPL